MAIAGEVFQQVIIIFLLILVGVVCKKRNLINQAAAKQLANVLLIVVSPALIIDSYQRDFDPNKILLLGWSFLFAILSHIIAIAIANVVIRKREGYEYRIERMGVVYSNCGFMAFPLLLAVLGPDGIFYGAAYVSVFNILSWTHGIKTLDPKQKMDIKKAFLNPGTIGFIIGFSMFLLSFRLPTVIGTAVSYVADLNTPLAMIISGVYLANIDFKAAIKNVRLLISVLLKLTAAPLFMILVMGALKLIGLAISGIDQVMLANVISTACPSATVVFLFSVRCGLDGEHGAKIFSLSTVLSVITIPVMVWISTFIF